MFKKVARSQSFVEPPNPPKKESVTKILPDEISSRILDLEMQCDGQSISIGLIYELVAHYTKAVEFYEDAGNQKYKQFQKRMHAFLQKPIVISLLKGQTGEMVLKKEKNEQEVRRAEKKADQEIKLLMEKSEAQTIKHKKKIQQQIQSQQKVLQERIQRKRTKSNRTARTKEYDVGDVNNGEAEQKFKEKMNMKLLLDGVHQRNNINAKKVYF